MSIIYHYCDLNAFISIIQQKKLRISDATKMNDFSEIRYFDSFLADRIHSLIKDSKSENHGQLLANFWEFYSINKKIPYICCFSSNGDLLSQWRAYADDGRGVSIGFSKDYFNFISENFELEKFKIPDIYPMWGAQDLKRSIGFLTVSYGKNAVKDKVDTIISLLSYKKEKDMIEPFDMYILNAALNSSISCKNGGFSEEVEERIVYTPFQMMNAEGHIPKNPGELSEIQFRSIGHDIVSFYEYSFDAINADNQPAIVEVVIGPKCALNEQEVIFLLGNYGICNVKVRRAESTYR